MSNISPAQQELQAAQALHAENYEFLSEKTQVARALTEELAELEQQSQGNAAKAAEYKTREAEAQAALKDAEVAEKAHQQSEKRVKQAEAFVRLEEAQDQASDSRMPSEEERHGHLQQWQEKLHALIVPMMEQAKEWDLEAREVVRGLSEAKKASGRPLPGVQIQGADWDPQKITVDTEDGPVTYSANTERDLTRMLEKAAQRASAEVNAEERAATQATLNERRREWAEIQASAREAEQMTDRVKTEEEQERQKRIKGH